MKIVSARGVSGGLGPARSVPASARAAAGGQAAAAVARRWQDAASLPRRATRRSREAEAVRRRRLGWKGGFTTVTEIVID